MIHTPHVDWFAISTILVLLGASGIALLSAVLVPRSIRRVFAATVAGLGCAGGLITSVWLYVDSANGHRVVGDAFYRDRWTALAQVILCGIGLCTVLLSAEHIPAWGRLAPRERHERCRTPSSTACARRPRYRCARLSTIVGVVVGSVGSWNCS